MGWSSVSAAVSRSIEELVLVRHGESVGNVADARARSRGAERLDLKTRDPDTPLSERGQHQARVLSEHVTREQLRRPDLVLTSPYVRAATTAQIVAAAMGIEPVLDERLRERDLGVFDGLTGAGIKHLHPEEAERRGHLGKFYYRPPGGESWTDVAQRVRQLLLDVAHVSDGSCVWVFTHQAVIMSFRLALEGLDETTLLSVDRGEPLGNCSLTRYRTGPDGTLELTAFADTRHLEASEVQETHEAPAESTLGAGAGRHLVAEDRDGGRT